MTSNLKLNLKVLRQMNEDFILAEASLAEIKDPEIQKKLFLECQEYRKAIKTLFDYYQKILNRHG